MEAQMYQPRHNLNDGLGTDVKLTYLKHMLGNGSEIQAIERANTLAALYSSAVARNRNPSTASKIVIQEFSRQHGVAISGSILDMALSYVQETARQPQPVPTTYSPQPALERVVNFNVYRGQNRQVDRKGWSRAGQAVAAGIAGIAVLIGSSNVYSQAPDPDAQPPAAQTPPDSSTSAAPATNQTSPAPAAGQTTSNPNVVAGQPAGQTPPGPNAPAGQTPPDPDAQPPAAQRLYFDIDGTQRARPTYRYAQRTDEHDKFQCDDNPSAGSYSQRVLSWFGLLRGTKSKPLAVGYESNNGVFATVTPLVSRRGTLDDHLIEVTFAVGDNTFTYSGLKPNVANRFAVPQPLMDVDANITMQRLYTTTDGKVYNVHASTNSTVPITYKPNCKGPACAKEEPKPEPKKVETTPAQAKPTMLGRIATVDDLARPNLSQNVIGGVKK